MVNKNVPCTVDARVINNVVRHQYRVLSVAESAEMLAIKDKGLELLLLIRELTASRETSIAERKVEEAVMWAVKAITS